MNPPPPLTGDAAVRVLDWAARRGETVQLTLQRDAGWLLARCQVVSLDSAARVLLVTYPIPSQREMAIEIVPNEAVGVAFRRGHKKCIFSTHVIGRQSGESEPPAVALAMPHALHEVQRRAYQRVAVPPDHPVPARLWEEGCITGRNRVEVPALLCSGQLRDLSAGGVLIEIDRHDDPRLHAGERLGVELQVQRGEAPLLLDATFRHIAALPGGKLGLGLQLVGLEVGQRNQATLQTLVALVSRFRQAGRRSNSSSDFD